MSVYTPKLSVYTPILSVYTPILSVYTLVFGWCVSQLVFLKSCNWLLTGQAYIRSVLAYIRWLFERIYAQYGRIYAQMYFLSINRQPWIAHFRFGRDSEEHISEKKIRKNIQKNTFQTHFASNRAHNYSSNFTKSISHKPSELRLIVPNKVRNSETYSTNPQFIFCFISFN